jgi:hypothetical protein
VSFGGFCAALALAAGIAAVIYGFSWAALRHRNRLDR